MNLKDLTELNNKLEIEKIEVKDNDFYVFYKNGKKKKLGRIFVTSVVSASGETPVGDYATKEWVLGKGYAQQSWVSEGFLPKGSLDDYATKEWVGEQGYLTETDLDGFATETWVKDQKYLVSSDLQGYATESWVSEQNYLTENDLNGYATEEWVENKEYLTSSSLNGYATEQWVENKGYIDDTYHDSTKADAIHTHTTSDITDFPANVSAFTNDAGYLTEHQSLAEYYTKTEVDNSLALKENVSNKISAWRVQTDNDHYPSEALVKESIDYILNHYQRKPVVVWQETSPANYLKGLQADLSASPSWQLTNLDLTPYKRIKIYSCAGQKSGATASASTTPAIVLEMSLDSRSAIAEYGGNYCGSVEVQKPNDANRFATLTCAVSADKTSFAVLRQSSIYGTAATSNNDVNANVFMIEGYYD